MRWTIPGSQHSPCRIPTLFDFSPRDAVKGSSKWEGKKDTVGSETHVCSQKKRNTMWRSIVATPATVEWNISGNHKKLAKRYTPVKHSLFFLGEEISSGYWRWRGSDVNDENASQHPHISRREKTVDTNLGTWKKKPGMRIHGPKKNPRCVNPHGRLDLHITNPGGIAIFVRSNQAETETLTCRSDDEGEWHSKMSKILPMWKK